jgi:MoaD family protein
MTSPLKLSSRKYKEASMPKVRILTPFRRFTGGSSEVEIGGSTVGDAIGNLAQEYPDLGRQLYTGDGKLHPSVNVCKGDEDIRQLDGAETQVSEGDELSIIPSIAGGFAEPRRY